MDDSMQVDLAPGPIAVPTLPLQSSHDGQAFGALSRNDNSRSVVVSHRGAPPMRDLRDIQVKVHVRRPERDNWCYLGKAVVSQEPISGQSSRVVVKSLSTGKVITSFSEACDLQAERRGNFVVVGCVSEDLRVVSWSLNALNNNETLRLLASIELACYKCRQAIADPRLHSKARRRIERTIKDDRRRRHRRRKDADAMISAFAKSNINDAVLPAGRDTMAAEPTPATSNGAPLAGPQLSIFSVPPQPSIFKLPPQQQFGAQC